MYRMLLYQRCVHGLFCCFFVCLQEGETFTKTSCYHYFHCHCLGRYASHSESELRQREKELEEDKTRDRTDYQVRRVLFSNSSDVFVYQLFNHWLVLQELTVVCPVCREPLTYDVDQLLSSPAPQLPEVTPPLYLTKLFNIKKCLYLFHWKNQESESFVFVAQLDEAAIGSSFQQKWCELQKLLERQRSKGGIIDPEEESNRFLIHINEVRTDHTLLDLGKLRTVLTSVWATESVQLKFRLFMFLSCNRTQIQSGGFTYSIHGSAY